MWYRVFGNDAPVDPAALLQHLHDAGVEVEARFGADDQGWFRAELRLPSEDEPILLQRYLASEAGIRAELNTWAAWLEALPDDPVHRALMQRIVFSRQVFTLQRDPQENAQAELCLTVCRYLARQTEGVYQVDGQGFFDSAGVLLVKED
jgi:hypothetical protein